MAGGERLEGPVQPAGVVRVVEVLHHDLPVPGQVRDRLALEGGGGLQPVVGEQLVDLGHGRAERAGLLVEVGHDEPLPELHLELGQAVVGPVEVRGAVHGRRAQQRPVEPVGPVVVRAGEPPAVARALGDHHAPVAAHRRQDAHLAVGVAGCDEGLARDGDAPEIAWIGKLVGPAHAQPLALEDGPALELVELGRRVQLGGEHPGLADRSGRVVEAGQELIGEDCHGSLLPAV